MLPSGHLESAENNLGIKSTLMVLLLRISEFVACVREGQHQQELSVNNTDAPKRKWPQPCLCC